MWGGVAITNESSATPHSPFLTPSTPLPCDSVACRSRRPTCARLFKFSEPASCSCAVLRAQATTTVLDLAHCASSLQHRRAVTMHFTTGGSMLYTSSFCPCCRCQRSVFLFVMSSTSSSL